MSIDIETDANNRRQSVSTGKLMDSTSGLKMQIKQRLYDVRETIDNHNEQIHSSIMNNVKQTVKYIQSMQKSQRRITKHHDGGAGKKATQLDPSMLIIRRIWDQVALDDESNGFGNPFSHQPMTKSRKPSTKIEKIKKREKIIVKTEPEIEMDAKIASIEDKKPRVTKGEAKELMEILEKSQLFDAVPGEISRNNQPMPTTVKLTITNTTIHRFKRQNTDDKMVNGSQI